jgi:23S rRNA G2445 N2-methylase RlmL
MAAKLMATCPNLVNDPTLSTWDLRIHAAAGTTQVELRPKRWVDPRFAYRLGFVPAASHPTIAAALARVAAVRPDDIVWDPFTGSGSELIECAFSGPVQALYGTDLDPEAIAVARGNAEAAQLGSRISLTVSDFGAFSGPRPTLIITNPPMGRRVQRGQLAEVLERFAEVAGALLAPGGRLVWLAPLPMRTNPIFERLGLSPLLQQTVDMGGFPAKLQHLVKQP